MPAIYTNHLDGIHHRMTLEALQGVNQHGLIIHIDKLLGDILSHPVAGTSGYYQRNIHNFISFYAAKVRNFFE
jgi:hypothetical protein